MKAKWVISSVAIGALTLAGCTADGNGIAQHQKAAIGTAVGALAGGVLGHQVNDDNGRYVGAVAGALAGAAIGNYMDKQQQQIQQNVAGSGIDVNRIDEGTLQLNIPNEVLFAVNESSVNPQFYQSLNTIAQTLQQYPSTIVHVYGFTDGSGRADYNMKLSQERAQNTAQYLVQQGVNSQRFVVRGYGEQMAKAERNPQDRRVEIFIKAIDEANPQAAYNLVY